MKFKEGDIVLVTAHVPFVTGKTITDLKGCKGIVVGFGYGIYKVHMDHFSNERLASVCEEQMELDAIASSPLYKALL